MRRCMTVSISVVLVLMAMVGWAIYRLTPAREQTPVPERPAQATIRILTWNVGTVDLRDIRMSDEVIEDVANLIAEAGADLVALQELRSEAQLLAILEALSRRGLPHWAKVATVDSRHPDGQSAVLCPHLTAEHLVLHSSVGFTAHGARFSGISVINVHAPPASSEKRARLLDELITWVKEQPLPVVIAGDLNLDPDLGLLGAWLTWSNRTTDQDTFAALQATLPIGSSVGPTSAFGWRFDHVRATSGHVIQQLVLQGVRRFPQDHEPLLVDLHLAPLIAPTDDDDLRAN